MVGGVCVGELVEGKAAGGSVEDEVIGAEGGVGGGCMVVEEVVGSGGMVGWMVGS